MRYLLNHYDFTPGVALRSLGFINGLVDKNA